MNVITHALTNSQNAEKFKFDITKEKTIANQERVRNAAEGYLGFKYDLQSRTIGPESSSDVKRDIVVDEGGYRCAYTIKRASEMNERSEGRQLGLHAAVPIGEIMRANVGGHFSFNKGIAAVQKESNIVCNIICLKIDRCRLRTFPQIKDGKVPKDYAVSVIVSGTTYVGCRILIEMVMAADSQSKTDSVGGGADISVERIAGIGFDLGKTRKKLQNHQFSKVIVRAYGIGGYSPRVSSHDLNEVEKIMLDFNDRYAACTREFYINPFHDLKYYRDLCPSLPLSLFPGILDVNSPSKGKLTANDPLQLIGDLANKIKASGRLYECIHDQLKMYSYGTKVPELQMMLLYIYQIFSKQFAHMPEKIDLPYCLVLGGSGVGKSTFIGYLLGHKIESTQSGRRKVLDYGSSDNSAMTDKKDRPVIGHKGSETKGSLVYENYMDTAGFTDCAGIETDICNVIAIQMAIESYHPQKIIFLIDSNKFAVSSDRGNGLFEVIEELCNIVPMEKRESWVKTQLVISDKKRQWSCENLLSSIDQLIEVRQTERNKFIPEGNEYSLLRANAMWSGNDKLESSLVGFKQAGGNMAFFTQVIKEQEKIEVLLTLKQKIEGNDVIIATPEIFQSEDVKNKMTSWVKRTEKDFFYQDIKPTRLVPNGRRPIEICIQAVKDYFNMLADKRKPYELECSGAQAIIDSIDKLIGSPDKDETIRGIQQEFMQKVGVFNEEKAKLEGSLEILNREIDRLKGKEELIVLQDIEPSVPIKARSYLSALIETGSNAQKYNFKVPSEITNIAMCKYIEGDPKHPGHFSILEGEFIRSRTVAYTPARGRHKRNCNTKIQLWVEAKDHPDTKAEIAKKHLEVGLLESQIQELQTLINDLGEKFKGLGRGGDDLQSKRKLYVDKKKEATEKIEEIDEQLAIYKDVQSLYDKVSSELNKLI